VNVFLADVEKTSRISQILPGHLYVSSRRDINTWVGELKSAAGSATEGIVSSGDTLAEMYAVMRAAVRKLEDM